MKVLLIGATGNVGLRLIAALLTHNHNVVAFVRSSSKLESLVPQSIYNQITVVQGSATDKIAIKKAILENNCDAVINSAGVAALPPWGTSDLPEIVRAVVEAVKEAGIERKSPLRVWLMAGLGVLQFPGSDTLLSSYVPIFLAHRENYSLLKSLPEDAMQWSMLCPGTMVPESSEIAVPTTSTHGKLIASGPYPPNWNDSWVKHIPLIGRPLVCAMNASRYEPTLEQAADFIAEDLEQYQSKWIGKRVGIIDASK